ncbi:MAG TPA: type II secretion system F family protein [Acidimicrobiia bacterium]|nr:type II secretion system F family protein [Acidimicrobiia bacterium]
MTSGSFAYKAALLGMAVAVTIRYQWLFLPGVVAVLIQHRRRLAPLRRAQQQAGADVVNSARTILVALTAGLPLPAAIAMAAEEAGPLVASELEHVLRGARRHGTAAALAASEGRWTRSLLSRLARAQTSGAPMSEAVAAYLTETQATRRAEAMERVRRLPVTLMIPLGLLILPGFIVLFVGPIVVGSVLDLFGQLP